MPNFKFFTLLLFSFSALLFQSCNGDDDTLPEAIMTALVDGETWTGAQIGAQIQQDRIAISGIGTDGSLITLSLEDMGEGTYEFDQDDMSAAVYSTSSDGSSPSFTTNATDMTNGTVEITSINTQDSLISGTFSFFAVRPIDNTEVMVTEGIFENVTYATQIQSVDDSNEFLVEIDGTMFEPDAIIGAYIANQNKITVTASDANAYPSVGLFMPGDIAVGTYELSTFGDYAGSYNPSDSEFMGADTGQLEITTHDTDNKIIEGSFSFEASTVDNAVQATLANGTFKVSY